MRVIAAALLAVLMMLPTASVANENWCAPENSSCDGGGEGDGGGGGGGGVGSSPCLKCVIGLDGKSYCKDPIAYGRASGQVLVNCQAVYHCDWLGTWECYYTCSGSPCHSV